MITEESRCIAVALQFLLQFNHFLFVVYAFLRATAVPVGTADSAY